MTILPPNKLSCNYLTFICVSFYRDIANNQTSREGKIRRFLNMALWPWQIRPKRFAQEVVYYPLGHGKEQKQE